MCAPLNGEALAVNCMAFYAKPYKHSIWVKVDKMACELLFKMYNKGKHRMHGYLTVTNVFVNYDVWEQ